MYDIIIVGAGPAGLTAAIYARRAGKSVLVLEKSTFGGQITYSPLVENYPGFNSVSGVALAESFLSQALEQGAEVDFGEVTSIVDGEVKRVITDFDEYEAKCVILAVGAKHRVLGLEREDELIGNGISFCAVCDGAFYADKEVAVIGGGNSALQEAILLSETSKKVTVVQNLDFLTGETRLSEKLLSLPNVEVIYGATVKEYLGEGTVSGIRVESKEKGEITLNVDGVFLAVGLIPDLAPFKDIAELDERGYAKSGENCRTGREGIFVAGDCRAKGVRQVTTAVADGATAALAAIEYLRK